MIEEGSKAPGFTLKGTDPEGQETEVSLSDVLNKGKLIILYFYPRDNTPGCTREACNFRDRLAAISDRAAVIGISPDSPASHARFREKNNLNFLLLSDPGHEILEKYGAWGEKKMYGKTTTGTIRSTVVIAPDGTVVKKWIKVKVEGHADTVVKFIESL